MKEIRNKLKENDEAFKTFDQVEIPEELKRYIHKTNKDSIDLITMSIEKILSLNLKFDIESFCIQIIRTLNKEQKIVFNHIIESMIKKQESEAKNGPDI